ncbi:MAG: O-antigen ligase family protein [Nitrospirae bacterium]|nr:O-antigen ligase family protein [Nitrospirota bacterium]
MAMKAPSLSKLTRFFVLFFACGVFQVFRGIQEGYPSLTSVRDLAFNYYGLYFFLGLWVGLRSPHFLPKLVRALAWSNGIYGVAYVLFLSNVTWIMPGVPKEVVDVTVFGQPLGSAIALIGLLAFESDLWSVRYLFLLNLFVLLAMQIRGEWLAFALGLLIWGWMNKRLKQFAVAGAYLILLFALMAAIDLHIPGPALRGGTISVRDIVGRTLAPINQDLAYEYTSEYKTAEDTVLFRTVWWAQIWTSVNESPTRALLGFGYGFPLGDLVPYLEGEFIRTPHNVFFYALGYTGWIGVAIFFGFQAELVKLLWRSWKQAGQSFGLLFWVTSLVLACFAAFFEAPYGAIPFYLVTGCACAPLFYASKRVPTLGRTPANRPPMLAPTSNAAG